MEYENNVCKNCGCEEFISQLNRYDVFINENGKLVYSKSEYIDDKEVLYCRNCSEILVFDNADIKM